MTRALIAKELHQHWPAFLLTGVLSGLAFGLLMVAAAVRGDAGSIFESARLFVMVTVVLAALILCNRLVVAEYQAKTQLFLEGLPLSRTRMVAVKYCLGLIIVFGLVAGGLAFSAIAGGADEAVSRRFLAILAARAFAYTWLAYNFFFLMGFLGRYRAALYLGAIIVLMAIDLLTDLELNRFGPFALMNERFAFERDQFPAEALRVTLGLAGVFLLLAFLIGVPREGSVANLLAERMSHREKVFVTTLLLGFLLGVTVFESKKEKEPFDLHDASVEERPGLIVKVAAGSDDSEEAARRLARRAADELDGVRQYLGLDGFPPVFITRRRDLEATQFERGTLTRAEGLHLRANFTAPDWEEQGFLAWLIRETLLAQSQDRLKLETKRWVLDGFPLFWVWRNLAADDPGQIRLRLRALYGTRHGFSVEDLKRWLRFREMAGDEIASGVAWFGLETLRQAQGDERCQAFLKSVLAAEVPRDARALIYESKHSLEDLLEAQAGQSLDAWFATWTDALSKARAELAETLAEVPILRGEVGFLPVSQDIRQVRYQLEVSPEPDLPLEFSFYYRVLPVLDDEVEFQDLKRERQTYPEGRNGELPEVYARGTRFYSAFAAHSDLLGCRIISGWERREIP